MKMTSLAPWNWLEDRDEFDSTAGSLMYPFTRMQREMERMMDMATGGNPNGRNGEINGYRMGKPDLNISESDDAYHLEFDLPGVKKEDLDVTFENGRLILRGERRSDKEEKGQKFRRVEKRYGTFERTINLPEDIDSERIEAHFENGVLDLSLPKSLQSPEKRKRIDIG
jgi:HSP20 family protein